MVGYLIGKTFTFSASHMLPGLPDGHKCARMHGHNYHVEVVVGADVLASPGFVTDFGDLAPLKTYLDDTFDHRHLNDVLDLAPTSEHLAAHLAVWIIEHLEPVIPGRLHSVRVSETDSTWAEYTPDRS
ncbi:6-carboxytetrahydropterin synthase [Polymorphospora sp. NPDC051019]|uniref:6-pyruvoyl trahydropterin synthase family protein n=1 Tax=Polymorphospora sp. NPDC051019 TaxID=3155725 RepID=UPI00341D52D3